MSRSTLDQAMAALTAGALEVGDHPSPDELVAYQAGKLAGDAAARLREPGLERTAAEEADDWQAIQERLGLAAARKDDPMPAPVPFDLSGPGGEAPPVPQRSYGPVHLLAAWSANSSHQLLSNAPSHHSMLRYSASQRAPPSNRDPPPELQCKHSRFGRSPRACSSTYQLPRCHFRTTSSGVMQNC